MESPGASVTYPRHPEDNCAAAADGSSPIEMDAVVGNSGLRMRAAAHSAEGASA